MTKEEFDNIHPDIFYGDALTRICDIRQLARACENFCDLYKVDEITIYWPIYNKDDFPPIDKIKIIGLPEIKVEYITSSFHYAGSSTKYYSNLNVLDKKIIGSDCLITLQNAENNDVNCIKKNDFIQISGTNIQYRIPHDAASDNKGHVTIKINNEEIFSKIDLKNDVFILLDHLKGLIVGKDDKGNESYMRLAFPMIR